MIAPRHCQEKPEPVYYLENIPEQHRLHPETFDKPSQDQLDGVKAGSVVKLIFLPTEKYEERLECRGERMWVLVTDIRDGKLTGTLDNEPVVFSEYLRYGDTIEFTFGNIADIYTKS